MGSFSMTSSTGGYSAQGPRPCAILIRFRLNELAAFAGSHHNKSEAGCLRVVAFSSATYTKLPTALAIHTHTIYAEEYIRTLNVVKGVPERNRSYSSVDTPLRFDPSRKTRRKIFSVAFGPTISATENYDWTADVDDVRNPRRPTPN
jgi:hypothetical protein